MTGAICAPIALAFCQPSDFCRAADPLQELEAQIRLACSDAIVFEVAQASWRCKAYRPQQLAIEVAAALVADVDPRAACHFRDTPGENGIRVNSDTGDGSHGRIDGGRQPIEV